MVETLTNSSPIPPEVQRQFLRRTPIKLKQFSRLLNDMLNQQVDSLRVKALLSQVTKTREACLKQEFESTGRLLHQLMKLLAMDRESLESQKPLLRRLSRKLLEHSDKLEMGVKPQKVPVLPAQEKPLPAPEEVSESNDKELDKPALDSNESELEEEPELDEGQTTPFGMYLDKGQLIFVDDTTSQTDGLSSKELCEQFDSMGVECSLTANFESAVEQAEANRNNVIIASLRHVDSLKVRADEAIEEQKIPLIFIADEDNQENRAKAIRNGGSGFVVEPASISTICKQIEQIYDVHADTPKRVLVMEDSKAQARYYEKVLSKGPFEVLVVNDPSVFLEAFRGFDPETVLMDMQMPDSSGIELTQLIRQLPRYAHLPIIFLSAEENLRKQNQALMSGGTAFIVKPVQKDQLMFMANLFTQRYRDLNPQIDVNPDTGLPYSPQFKQMIALESERISRTPGSIALAIISLDGSEELAKSANYSFINSTLLQLALLLKKRLRKTDIIGHVDSGKLGVILTSGRHPDWITIMRTVQQHFADISFHLQHKDKAMSVSIGISSLKSNFNAHQWLERSHKALETAIESGDSGLVCYENEDGSS
ncbi:MAG: response regulator [Kangiellaceae bacterium]|nr:response regulator [Kangiellaceae bacterium]